MKKLSMTLLIAFVLCIPFQGTFAQSEHIQIQASVEPQQLDASDGPYFELVFQISIPDEDAEKIGTVGDAVSYLKEKLG